MYQRVLDKFDRDMSRSRAPNDHPGHTHADVAAAKQEFMEKLRYTFDEFLSIIRYFILSQNEIRYIDEIEAEVMRGERLDKDISRLSQSINQENEKKRDKKTRVEIGQSNKRGDGSEKIQERESPEKLLQNITILENKLEKAHQKLNTTVSQNAQYREKINILRKEKNVIEDIYDKLKKELKQKKDTIKNTILKAGNAFVERGNAEEELKELQNKAEEQKKAFELQCGALNKSIEKEKKFKEFLQEKQKEKEKVDQLKEEIEANKKAIEAKHANNEKLNREYSQSAQKEQKIKDAFEQITKETGISDCKELVEVFQSLNDKNERMDVYSNDLQRELNEIDKNIEQIKTEIARYNTSGATKDVKKHEIKVNLSQKIVLEEKKKQILKEQYKKSLDTMGHIKTFLEGLLESIKVSSEKTKELKEASATEENLMQYFAILEEKGIEIVSEYARLIAGQIENDKRDVPDVEQQIGNLENIIQYENANILHSFLKDHPNKQEPNPDLFIHKEGSNANREEDEEDEEEAGKFKDRQKFLKMAAKVLDPKKDMKAGTGQKPKTLKPKKK